MPPTAFLIQWFITWVILAVVFYVAADQIQRALYEVPIEKLAWRVMFVTPLLAAALVKWPLPFQNIFFNMFATACQAVLWFLACWLALRFQWQHAAAAGLIAIVTIAPVASSTVDSIKNRWLTGAPAKTATPTPAATGSVAPAPANPTAPAGTPAPATK